MKSPLGAQTNSVAFWCLCWGAGLLGFAYRSFAVAGAVLMLGFFLINLNDGKNPPGP